eukprot:jgi/Ulvmu1/3070/UM015_0110.1
MPDWSSVCASVASDPIPAYPLGPAVEQLHSVDVFCICSHCVVWPMLVWVRRDAQHASVSPECQWPTRAPCYTAAGSMDDQTQGVACQHAGHSAVPVHCSIQVTASPSLAGTSGVGTINNDTQRWNSAPFCWQGLQVGQQRVRLICDLCSMEEGPR